MGEPSFVQSVTLKVVSKVSASLSIIGSTLIITSIFQQQKQLKHLKESTLHQLLFGLSTMDIICSLITFGAGFLNPRESRDVNPLAIGNQYTCSAGGFLYIFSATAANFYNMFLSLHFWRKITTIKKRAVSSQSSKQKDWWFRFGAHSTSTFIPFLFSMAGIITNSYHTHDFVGFCYYTEYPHGCDKDPNVQCEGGTHAALIGRVRTGVISIVAIISIAVTIMLAIHVWRNIDRSRQYSLRRQLRRQNSSTPTIQQQLDNNSERSQTQDRSNNNGRQREVAAQAIWYMLAYANSFVFILTAAIVTKTSDNRGNPGHFTLLLLLAFFQPLQGALNFIVFIRPRYKVWKIHLEKQQHRDPENNPLPPFSAILKKAIMEQVPSCRQPAPGGRKTPHDKHTNNNATLEQGQGSNHHHRVHLQSLPSRSEGRLSYTARLSSSRAIPPTIPEDFALSNHDDDDERKESELASVSDVSFDDLDESHVFGIDPDDNSG